MKNKTSFLLALVITLSFLSGCATNYKAPSNVDKFYQCLDNVNKVTCDYRNFDFKSDPNAMANYYACYTPARKKCGCDNQIAAECK